MIEFLLDSSALWRFQREPAVGDLWEGDVAEGSIGSCEIQRLEFRRSARSLAEFDRVNALFRRAFPDVPIPTTAWRWAESAQHVLAAAAVHRALSPVDLLICATAAHHGLTVLHDDGDLETAAQHLSDVRAQRVAN